MDLEARVNELEFKQRLLFENSTVDRILFEYNIKESEYHSIMDLMAKYRDDIESGKDVSSTIFESEMYELIPSLYGNYHFCEFITKAFAEDGQWEEVFPTLYRHSPKYKKSIDIE